MKPSFVADSKYLDIINLLNHRSRKFNRGLVSARRVLLSDKIPKNGNTRLKGNDVDVFLRLHTKRIINEILEIFKDINNYHAIFILSRLPLLHDWRNATYKSAVNRKIMSLDIALSAGDLSKSLELIKGPDITENALWTVLRFEDLCAELHFTQSVYRTIQKIAFFGKPRELEFRSFQYHSIIPKEVKNAIISYDNRCSDNAGALYDIDAFLPNHTTTQLGLNVSIPRQPVDQLILYPEERAIPFLPAPLNRKGSYICIKIDVTSKIKAILNNCYISKINNEQSDAIKSLLCLSALRQHLLDIRCHAIADGIYGYDLEIKGYIPVARTEENGLFHCLKRLINDCNLTEYFIDSEKFLDKWLDDHTSKHTLPTGLDYLPSSSIAIKLNKERILYFPVLFQYLEYDLFTKLTKIGGLGLHFGQHYEDWAINDIRNSKLEQWGWKEWIVQKKLYASGSKEEFDEIDFSCYKDNVLFIIDMKSSRKKLTLTKKEAENSWKKIKKEFYISEDNTAKNIVRFKHNMNVQLPDNIKYIVPIVCILQPVFTKLQPEYCLLSISGSPIIPRICTTDELAEVLSKFDQKTYLQNGGHYIAV